MEKEEQKLEEQGAPAAAEETQQEEHVDKLKETTEKLWGSTRSAWNTAAFKAAQYKKLVQKKIDISTLHKKISAAHTDLGKLIDELRAAGRKNIMNQGEVKEILTRIDDLKGDVAALEEEVEKLKSEEPAEEAAGAETPEEDAEK